MATIEQGASPAALCVYLNDYATIYTNIRGLNYSWMVYQTAKTAKV